MIFQIQLDHSWTDSFYIGDTPLNVPSADLIKVVKHFSEKICIEIDKYLYNDGVKTKTSNMWLQDYRFQVFSSASFEFIRTGRVSVNDIGSSKARFWK